MQKEEETTLGKAEIRAGVHLNNGCPPFTLCFFMDNEMV
jgi:hypothetical protein